MSDKSTAPRLLAMKERGEKIVCLTAYDAYFGRLVDESGVDAILVGDSVGNVLLGYDTTIPVTLDEMLHHTRAVRRGVKRALLIADLPFGSYQSSISQAIDSAVALMKAGAEAVKLEGDYPETVAALVKAGIPTMGHLGMTPQSVHRFGGFRVQGRGDDSLQVSQAAGSLGEAGAFGIVLELIPSELAKEISGNTKAATIGIGAGQGCDGQIQVLHDVLGFGSQIFKHAKPYMSGETLASDAMKEYVAEVRDHSFPTVNNSF
jgi:3-methyl-2-oxobutanoate hydroxymethyltransferase